MLKDFNNAINSPRASKVEEGMFVLKKHTLSRKISRFLFEKRKNIN